MTEAGDCGLFFAKFEPVQFLPVDLVKGFRI